MRRLLACLVLAGLASPAAACINDNELPTHEREFRSQYGGVASRPPDPSAGPVDSRLIAAGGVSLLAGAVVVATRGRTRA